MQALSSSIGKTYGFTHMENATNIFLAEFYLNVIH